MEKKAKRVKSNVNTMKVQTTEQAELKSFLVVIGVVLIGVWYVFFYGANLTESWFGKFTFDSSELPIITMYGMYFPIFINMIRKERKELGVIKGIILPILALIASGFMVFAAIYSHGIKVVYYLIVYVIIMAVGILLFKLPVKEKKEI